jgi:hypothetical protein
MRRTTVPGFGSSVIATRFTMTGIGALHLPTSTDTWFGTPPRIAPRFSRAEPRQRARTFVRGILSGLRRPNGWTLARYAGDDDPNGMQRLLNAARWDVDGVRDDLRAWVVEHLAEPRGGVLVVHETAFPKKGDRSVGVYRRYGERTGRAENVQVGVFLAYTTQHGSALVDRELYLPASWTDDRERCRRAGVPDDVGYVSRPELARRMVHRALNAGVPAAWIAADEPYGDSDALRAWLEERDMGYALATNRDARLTTATGARRRGTGTGPGAPRDGVAPLEREPGARMGAGRPGRHGPGQRPRVAALPADPPVHHPTRARPVLPVPRTRRYPRRRVDPRRPRPVQPSEPGTTTIWWGSPEP